MKRDRCFNKEKRRQRIELLELRTKLYRKAHKAGNFTPEQKKDYLIKLIHTEAYPGDNGIRFEPLSYKLFGSRKGK